MKHPAVILIGGAPGVGKTTLGIALAARLSFASLSIDDLMSAAQAVTTPETHPELHIMRTLPYLDYFTNTSVDQLKADAEVQHAATWPIVERVIRKHAAAGPGIAIDGWHLRPRRVAGLDLENVRSVWLVAAPSVLESRERSNPDWLRDSADPERMLQNFLARSLWYNDLIKNEAGEAGMNVLVQSGAASVDQLCTAAVAKVAG